MSPPGPYVATSAQVEPAHEEAQGGAPRITRVWITGPMAVACLSASMTLGSLAVPASATTPLEARTATPQVRLIRGAAGERAPSREGLGTPYSPVKTVAESVTYLHDQTGLTWEQLGKLFGVSRRAVHMWAAGKRMNARNVQLLGELLRLVRAAPVESPDARRMWLFAPEGDGVSPIERFLAEHRRPGPPLSGSGYTPAGLLGISDE